MKGVPFCFLIMLLALCFEGRTAAQTKPNIVWILVDDMSAHFSCYGETTIRTPHVDAMAKAGTRFSRAFVTAPICSICRSALITGRYQTSIGCQNHRSGSAKYPIHLPTDTPVVPTLLSAAGYHCSNISIDEFLRTEKAATDPVKVAKTDYNFVWKAADVYQTTHWTQRMPSQPFFVQVQLHGGKHRGEAPGAKWANEAKKKLGSITPESEVKLPPYLPDDPVIRADWAQYLDTVRYTDWEVGQIISRLQESGVLDNTVVIFLTDHGISHVRNKQFLYDGGTHVPLVIRGPGIEAGKLREDLVEHIDVAAVSLSLAGLPLPATMQARNVLAKDYEPRKFAFAARDRADETVDRIRSVRSQDWKYIRNFFPARPYLQPNRYKDEKAVVEAMRRLHAEKKLNPAQSLIMAETRPREELYDLRSDPFELNNLAADPVHADKLKEMGNALDDWMVRTNDQGRTLESKEVYLHTVNNVGKNAENPSYQKNIKLMLRWDTEKPMVP